MISEQDLEKIVEEICHKTYGYKMFSDQTIKKSRPAEPQPDQSGQDAVGRE